MTRLGIVLGLIGLFGATACGDKPRRPAAGQPSAAAPTAAVPASQRPAPPPPKPQPVFELAEQDFIEGASNRDPFRSYMSEFVRTVKAVVPDQRPAKLDRYAIDELTLIAVVTGDVRARAMFRDPKGTGVTVRRGDLLSKSRGRVKMISEGRVVIEIREQYEGGEKVADRVVELHGKAAK